MEIDVIEEFIKTKRGKSTYKSWLTKYFEILECEPGKYFEQKQNYDTDVLKFVEKIKPRRRQNNRRGRYCTIII